MNVFWFIPTHGDSRYLGTTEGAPLLAVDRLTLTYGDRPVEVRRGLCVTKDFHYLNELL